MFIAVIDTETTGNEDADQVCEIAVVGVTMGGVGRGRDQLIKPTCSISPVARAVHHITDEELRCAPTMTELMQRRISLLNILKNADYVAGHSVDFDLKMLAQSGFECAKPKVCTWVCARHLWPNAPAYGNQVLRYWLNLDVPRTKHPPHRAMTDALATACLLTKMLETKHIANLVELTVTPVLLQKVTFGKYRGLTWREVRLKDRGYLAWILRQDDFGADERHTAQHWQSKTREEIDGEEQGGQVLQIREGQTYDISAAEGRNSEGPADARSNIPEV